MHGMFDKKAITARFQAPLFKSFLLVSLKRVFSLAYEGLVESACWMLEVKRPGSAKHVSKCSPLSPSSPDKLRLLMVGNSRAAFKTPIIRCVLNNCL